MSRWLRLAITEAELHSSRKTAKNKARNKGKKGKRPDSANCTAAPTAWQLTPDRKSLSLEDRLALFDFERHGGEILAETHVDGLSDLIDRQDTRADSC